MRSFDTGNIEGTDLKKLCLMFLYVSCVVLCLHGDQFCGLTWEKVHKYIWEEFWNVNLLLTVWLSWGNPGQDDKIQLLTNYLTLTQTVRNGSNVPTGSDGWSGPFKEWNSCGDKRGLLVHQAYWTGQWLEVIWAWLDLCRLLILISTACPGLSR